MISSCKSNKSALHALVVIIPLKLQMKALKNFIPWQGARLCSAFHENALAQPLRDKVQGYIWALCGLCYGESDEVWRAEAVRLYNLGWPGMEDEFENLPPEKIQKIFRYSLEVIVAPLLYHCEGRVTS